MTQSTMPTIPGLPAPTNTVIPFPLPWGQTGCCPPGGMSALMQCYCDIQQASAFIAQIMIDQINNNPDVVAAIIAAIEKSGSTLPTIGVTDGSNAQPGQVGEMIPFNLAGNYATGNTTQVLSLGVLPPGDWDLDGELGIGGAIDSVYTVLTPQPAGFSWNFAGYQAVAAAPGTASEFVLISLVPTRASVTVPTLLAIMLEINAGTNPGANFQYVVRARRRR